MPIIDESTTIGQRTRERLANEHIVWLTTTRADGTPQPTPVWFLPDGDDTIIIFSEPRTPKIRAIRANPRVSLAFNATPEGGDVQIIQGDAEAPEASPRAEEFDDYVAKYASGLQSLGMTPASFSDQYSQLVRVRVRSLRGW